MKNLKIAVLFFFVLNLAFASSFREYKSSKFYFQIETDSLEFHSKLMRTDSLSYDIRLSHANKALYLANKENLISKKTDIIYYKIYLFGNLRKYDSAIYYTKKILKRINPEDFKNIAGENSRLGYYYMKNSQKDSAYHCYILSNDYYSKIGDSAKIGQNLSNIASIQSKFGDYEGSDVTAIEALKYIDVDNLDYRAYVYNSLAISSRLQKDYKEAIYWYDKALNYSTQSEKRITVLQNKANIYRDLKKYKEAISILDSLSTLDIKNNRTKAMIIDNLAYTRWLNNENKKDPSNLFKALNIRIKDNDLLGLNASYSHLADFYEKENPKLGLLYASKMYQLASSQKSSQDQLEALQKLIKLDNSVKLKEYYAAYIRISDSVSNADKQVKNRFAKIKYDSKKNREENLLLKIETSQKDLEVEKGKFRNIIGAVSSGTIVMSLLAFGYYRRQKHKQEKREEIYKTETRIAKKIHDEVANNVVNIMNKVQYTAKSKEELLDDLEKVYLLTRNISHQNKSIETGESFENSLKTLLSSFNSSSTTMILKDIHNVELKLLQKDKQIEIYRVLQELMVNMKKHSKASLVAISFKKTKDQYEINYSDNGVGLEFEKLNLKNGLKNVESRMKSIKGIITFETSLNKGFKAFISFKR